MYNSTKKLPAANSKISRYKRVVAHKVAAQKSRQVPTESYQQQAGLEDTINFFKLFHKGLFKKLHQAAYKPALIRFYHNIQHFVCLLTKPFNAGNGINKLLNMYANNDHHAVKDPVPTELLDFQQYQLAFTKYLRQPKSAPKPAKVSAEGMAIYTEIVFNNIVSSVSACFPVAQLVMGKRAWTKLIRDFVIERLARRRRTGRRIQETMMLKTIVGAICAIGVAGSSMAASLSGAGATFPAPVYAKWAETYRAQTGNTLNYQAIGSGGGIKQINANTVDFGATDKPLKADDLAQVGLAQFPMVIGGVVPVMNLPGIRPGQLKMNGPVLSDIYRGVIKRWNAPAIAAINPGVALPNMPITVVHRSDGSGTTFLFTSYLAMKAPHWASGPGANDSVNWPVGIGGPKNDGVAALVRQTPGAIGYVEYAYAKQNHMDYALMQNKAGQWVAIWGRRRSPGGNARA